MTPGSLPHSVLCLPQLRALGWLSWGPCCKWYPGKGISSIPMSHHLAIPRERGRFSLCSCRHGVGCTAASPK